MIKCPSCSIEVDEEKQACPSCGTSLEDLFAPTRQLTDSQRQAAVHRSQPPSSRRTRQGSVHSSITPDYDTGNRFAPGSVFAERYRIVGLLGRGGMGEVYRADDLKLGQPVALKFLPENLLDDGAALARFHREVRTARQITHRNVCRVYDIGEIEGEHFLSMEFVRGEDLASLLRRIGRLPSDKAVEIARQLCAGLAAAHDIGVLHRDLKPANIMIDAQGNVRIMDFGLAGLEEELREARAIEGTPEYMSPEQLAGKELTAQSDIYSLGLVLYEVFTGKKAFEAASLAELLRLRKKDTSPASISSLNKHIDPLVERIIERCLERDPDKRPSSAIQVAAALPGGDPLAAALAAGETPSPEMVAAAKKEGTLKPALAIACLASVLVSLALVVLLSGQVKLHRYVPLEKSPDVLRERARDIIQRTGYTSAPTDYAYGMGYDTNYLRIIRDTDKSAARWEKLRTGHPPILFLWYRQSPRYLVPYNSQVVTGSDPPPDVTGMARASVDMQGRLMYFTATPPQFDEAEGKAAPYDWSALFRESGLDIANFKQVAPKWTPPRYTDERAAWEGVLPGEPPIPIRVEAGSFRGKPTYFEVVFPWDQPFLQIEPPRSSSDKIINSLIFSSIIIAMVAGALLAWHNLRLGRGDRRGATRLALFVFILSTLNWAMGNHHVPEIGPEFNNFMNGLGMTLVFMGLAWVMYVALEPLVRRRWPGRIISWTRFLGGDVRDPLVGRDILIGGLLGLLIALTFCLWNLTPGWLGRIPTQPARMDILALLGFRQFITQLTNSSLVGLIEALGFMFLLLLLYIVLRKQWLAIGAGWLILSVALFNFGFDPAVDWFYAGLTAAIIFTSLVRFGLLSTAALFFFLNAVWLQPLTSDFTSWYAWGTVFIVFMLAALSIYGFITSLGGQKLSVANLLQD
ncbi:MAG TPA: serine/threonine-protein kinase [Pyrinomonadaceae bacterium]|nr:serine/threonine-protein kinase [Pyrinomonadaceae bacterium]